MQINWLRTFIVAAECENFRLASEKLFISQPTVTVHIHHLEQVLGIKLFEKNGRNIELTPAGKHYIYHAKKVVQGYNQGLQSLSSWQQGYDRKLTLAVSPLIASSILSYIVKRFMERFPQIEVVVQVYESQEIGNKVMLGDANLGISRIKPIQPELTCEALYEDPVILIAQHDGGDPESSPPIELNDLLRNDVLLTHNHPLYWDDLLTGVRSIYPHLRTMVVSQVHVTKRFIEEGIGFSFLPRSSVRRELLEGRVLEVHTQDVRLPMTYTYLVQKDQSEEVQQFIEFVSRYYLG
ncbi:LysR family transcriptional regulator [Pseudalkalibacillus decolorationis]|uniref:LysR family transcriptional regulator n=1 Tax=Pseudalkalibacillus decolorationis TaxID=163879 RepID=UPI0021487DD5|nr:LysR family transcriptional regulator [Pseudalkalibacillus decolorationis]